MGQVDEHGILEARRGHDVGAEELADPAEDVGRAPPSRAVLAFAISVG